MERESEREHPLKAWRLSRKLTLEEAAALVESSKSSLSAYENRRKVPRPKVMMNIVRVTAGAVTANDFYVSEAA